MAATFSDGTTTVTPLEVLGYESSRPSRNVIHTVVGSEGNAVTLRPAGLRKGTLEALCSTLADALTLEAMFAQDLPFTFAVGGLAGLAMTFVTSGDIGVKLDDETRNAWVVSVDFQEVAP